jgi:hypothetical protein
MGFVCVYNSTFTIDVGFGMTTRTPFEDAEALLRAALDGTPTASHVHPIYITRLVAATEACAFPCLTNDCGTTSRLDILERMAQLGALCVGVRAVGAEPPMERFEFWQRWQSRYRGVLVAMDVATMDVATMDVAPDWVVLDVAARAILSAIYRMREDICRGDTYRWEARDRRNRWGALAIEVTAQTSAAYGGCVPTSRDVANDADIRCVVLQLNFWATREFDDFTDAYWCMYEYARLVEQLRACCDAKILKKGAPDVNRVQRALMQITPPTRLLERAYTLVLEQRGPAAAAPATLSTLLRKWADEAASFGAGRAPV